MDFRLFARVLWRFKFLTAIGFVVAVGLAVLSVAKVGPQGVTYRNSISWAATERMGVSTGGFSWGRITGAEPSGRTSELTVLYAELVSSDPVRRVLLRTGPIDGTIAATAVTTGWGGSIQLPFIDLTAVSSSPEAAASLAQRASDALRSYIKDQQTANGIAPRDRIQLQTVELPTARTATVFKGRSKTMPLLIFVLVMAATMGLAFLLENLRPRAAAAPESELRAPEPVRRTA